MLVDKKLKVPGDTKTEIKALLPLVSIALFRVKNKC